MIYLIGWVILIGITLRMVTKKLGLTGLIGVGVMLSLAANILASKSTTVLGLSMTVGTFCFIGLCLTSDIVNELYGKKHAFKTANTINIVNIFWMLIFQAAILLPITEATSWFQPSLEGVFSYVPRITLAGLFALLISSNLNVIIYNFIKNKFPKHLWIRKNISTVISQLVDSILFMGLSFIGVMPINVLIEVIISMFIIKMLLSILETPVMYLIIKNIKK